MNMVPDVVDKISGLFANNTPEPARRAEPPRKPEPAVPQE